MLGAGGGTALAQHLPPPQAVGVAGGKKFAGDFSEKRLPTNLFKMAEACCCADGGRHYHRVEKTFIEETYHNRTFQKAKEGGKVICHECYSHNGKIAFFTSAGVEYHYRRVHKQMTSEHDVSSKLFHEMHFNESKKFIEQLSNLRAVNHADCNTYKEYVLNSEHLKVVDIFAKNKTEAVKLAGLVLSHGNFVKSLSKDGYPVSVLRKGDPNDSTEKFLVWKASTKIYAESVYTREVCER